MALEPDRKKHKGFNGSAQRGAATRRVSARDGDRCSYCMLFLIGEAITIDHVIPLVSGGPHNIGNFVIACSPCNQAKGETSEVDFRASPFLLARRKMIEAQDLESEEG